MENEKNNEKENQNKTLSGWKTYKGIELGWYNEIYINVEKQVEIILSNCSDKHEGTDHKDSKWCLGIHKIHFGYGDKDKQKTFKNYSDCIKHLNSIMGGM